MLTIFSQVPRPDGNTILHIFGSWLFEAVKLNRTSYVEMKIFYYDSYTIIYI